jgi:hypothetical protein
MSTQYAPWWGGVNDDLWAVDQYINGALVALESSISITLTHVFREITIFLNEALRAIAAAMGQGAEEAVIDVGEANQEVADANRDLAILLGTQVILDQGAVTTGTMFVGGGILSRVRSLINWLVENVRSTYKTLAGVIKSIETVIEKVLEAIHFKTILKIHRILQIVSPQYRAVMKKIYDKIARISEALGLGPQFLLLALMNVRNLVMDVGSMFGKSYDLTQLEWMATLNRYLQVFTTRMTRYRNDPEALLFDLGEMIERPSTDAKGSFQRGIITSLQGVLEVASNIGDGLAKIGVDIVKLHEDLPAFVKRTIPDPGTVFWNNLAGFLTDHYNPTISALQGEIDTWQAEMTDAQTRVGELVEKLRKPGDLVRVVDDLPQYEREEQEAILSEVTNRRLRDLMTIWAPDVLVAREELQDIVRQPIPPVTPSLPLSYEPMGLTPVTVGPQVQRSTWFVGDY